jgi:MFS family permease
MYLLLSLITRYVQTPVAAGYGFGLTTWQAGLVLVPFSVLGFVAGKAVPPLRRRVDAHVVLLAGAVAVLAAFLLFTLARARPAEVVAAMAVLGFGAGTFPAALPAVILAVTPEAGRRARRASTRRTPSRVPGGRGGSGSRSPR